MGCEAMVRAGNAANNWEEVWGQGFTVCRVAQEDDWGMRATP